MIKNVKMAKENVMVKFPVTLTPSGVNPKIFKNKMKKKMVNK